MILGSSECKDCSNVYLVSIIFFILCGVALVTILTLLNMTVSVGTLNGLILLANFLQANRTAFLRPTTSHTRALITFLDVFIAWLNLVWCPDPSRYKRTRKRMRERGEKGLVKNYGAPRAQEFVSSGCGYNEYHYRVMNNISLS